MAGLIIRKRKVAPAFTPYSFVEPFNTDGALNSYANWRADTYNSIYLNVASQQLTTNTSTSDGARGAWGCHETKPNSLDNYVEAKVAVRAPQATDAGIWLHGTYNASANAPGSKAVVLVITSNSTTNGIYTFDASGAGFTKRATLGSTPALGVVVRLTAALNANGNYVYTAYVGTGLRCTWEDTGHVAFPSTDQCYGGVYEVFSRSFFSNSYSCGWDDFKFGDLAV